MTYQELCTQYELLAALIESGNAEKAVEILIRCNSAPERDNKDS